MQRCFLLLIALSSISVIKGADPPAATLPKTQSTRTSLHVSRSLNPDTTQLLQVKTRTGDLATLIVKKRDGKQQTPPSSAQSNETRDAILRHIKAAVLDKNAENRKRYDANNKRVPSPVDIRSIEQFVKSSNIDTSSNDDLSAKPRATSLPVSMTILGQASSPQAQVRVPPPVYIRSMPMFVKGEREGELKRGRSLMKIGSDGIPVIHGVRMPDDESDKQVWRNARVINGVLVPNEKPDQIVKKENKKTAAATTMLTSVPFDRRQDVVTTSFDASHIDRLVPFHRTSTDSGSQTQIMNYIKTVNQREMDRNVNNKPKRGRMIQFPTSRHYQTDGNAEFYQQPESESVKFPTKRSDKNIASATSDEFQPRMLHYGSPIYPTSLLYTPQSKKPARASFEEGVRTPVLQYAHPELGVQPARLQPKSAKAVPDASGKLNAATIAMFQQDLHSDRSPYVGMETEIDTDTSDKRSSDSTDSPKNNFYKSSENANKNFAYDNQNYEFPKKNYYHSQDSYGLSNDDYIKRYPYDGYNGVNSYNSYSGPYLVKVVERPFWEQITDTIRDHVQTGMDRVSDLTRPVVEPLIEASHKISKNLGFSQRSNGVHEIQEKVGGAVATYPVLLPALGLMAGGAALGLGAVAVGRYLDVDMMRKRSEEMGFDSMEHKRAMEGIQGGEWVVIQDPSEVSKLPVKERSLTIESEDAGSAQEGRWVIVEQVEEGQNIPETEKDQTSKNPNLRREKQGSWIVVETNAAQYNTQLKKANKLNNNEEQNNNNDVKPQLSLQSQWAVVAKEAEPSTIARDENSQTHRRKRATESDFLTDLLQNIESSTPSGIEHLERHPDWTNTPCSKKLFCDTMIQQTDDAILLMEKKMATFLNLIEPNAAVSFHLGDVMAAVKRRDCSTFVCTESTKRQLR